MIQLVHQPIDTQAVLQSVHDVDCGAAVLFLGMTRRWTGAHETLSLSYEAHTSMAFKVLENLEAQARDRWDVKHVSIVHRLGEVSLGESSVAVAVSSPHREAAFHAAKWLIDTLKQDAPIWKQDIPPEGHAQWIHPDASSEVPSAAFDADHADESQRQKIDR